MAYNGGGLVFQPISTVGGATITVSSAYGNIFGGAYLNGSAGGTTLVVRNGAVAILSTSAGAAALIPIYPAPTACPNGIVATCSGTGFYTVLVAK
jgi:hypothetical protein